MIFEKLFFNIIAFLLFGYIFWKLISKNDTNYVYILIVQAIGICLDFIEIIANTNFPIILKILMYVLCIILPALLSILEKKEINISELIMLIKCRISKTDEDRKQIILSILNKYPNSYIAHKNLAQIYEKENDKENAMDEYIKVVDINSKDYDSYYKIAVILNEMGKKSEAQTMLNKLLKTNKAYYKASILLGEILYEKCEYKEAINVYMGAISNNPDDYELYYSMGMVYTMMNDFQNAKICYEKAALINSMLYNAYYNLGQINLMFNDLDEAKQYFIKAAEGEEIEAQSYYHLALVEMIKGNKDNAIKYLNESIKIDDKIYGKIFHEPVFITIRNEVIKPERYESIIQIEQEENSIKKDITDKEKQVQNHLDNMYSIVGNLNNLDSKVIMNKEIKIQKESKEQEIESNERNM